MRVGGAKGPQGGPGGRERGADTPGHRPDKQRVADVEHDEPGAELTEQDDRRLARQETVAPPVACYRAGDQPVDTGDRAGDQAR